MPSVPDVRFNFSGSNQLASNAQNAFAQAGSVFASLNKQRQDDAELKQRQEQNAIKNQQIERNQIFAEGANQRALDLENARIQQERNRRIQDNQITSGVIGQLTDKFSLSDLTRQAIQNDPRFQNLKSYQETRDENGNLVVINDTTKQDKIFKDLNDRFRQNPNLILDPQEIKRNILQKGNELGWSDEVIARQLNKGLASFRTLDPEISKTLIEQNGTNQGQIASLLGKFGGNGSSSGSGGGSSSAGNVKDARARYKFEKDEVLSDYSAERGIIDKIIPGFIDDTNVSRENLSPVLDTFNQVGLESASTHNALKSLGYISGDKEWNVSPEEIRNNPDIQRKIIASATAFQGGLSKGSSTGSSGPSLSTSLGLLKASQQDLQNQNNSILSKSSPTAVSAAERRKIALDFLGEQTGVSLADLDQPTEQQQKAVKSQFINTVIPKPKPKTKQIVENKPSLNKDKFFEKDAEDFQKIIKEGSSLNPQAKVFQEGTKENKLAFEKLRDTRSKERAVKSQETNEQLEIAIATAKRLIEKNTISPSKMAELKNKLKQLESERSK